jgi:CheY-like chemotaxis protein
MSDAAYRRRRAKTVLYIDDSADDLFLFRHACQEAQVSFILRLAHGCHEAMRYISGADQFADRDVHPLPDFIFLDIKMPEMDGFEVLNWIRTQPSVSQTPVAMYSSSSFDKDVLRGYLGGTTFYIPKAQGLNALRHLAGAADECLTSEGENCEALMALSIEPARI